MSKKERKPLKFNNLLIQNVNTWGNVQYKIPLRLSSTETRTSASVAHRHIPPVDYTPDCKIKNPLPLRVSGRDMVVSKETYRTTSGEYCVKPNPNKAMERADCAINCRRVIYMTHVEKELQAKNVVQPRMLSEMKDHYRGRSKPLFTQPDVATPSPQEEYIYDVLASGRAEAPVIPENSNGFYRLLDPYLSTYRNYHKCWSLGDHQGIAAKDHITFYTESNTPKVKGFGPKYKEIWIPLTATVKRPVYDRIHVGKPFKEVAANHNPVSNIKGVFESEMKRKYKVPFAVSAFAAWSHGEVFDLAPIPPNPYQTNMAPFMYCSDYCHIAQGTPPDIVVDQLRSELPPHKKCVQRMIVSRDFSL